MQRLGARLNHRLGMVKGIALTIPASALPALEADPEVLSVTVDHPMKGLDDITDVATSVTAAWNAGYNGAGIGVAVIDSGINDSHPDLWDSPRLIRAWSITRISRARRPQTRVEQRTTFTVTAPTSPESWAATVTSLAGTSAEWRRRKSGRPACPGSQRRRHRQQRDRGHSESHRAAGALTTSE